MKNVKKNVIFFKLFWYKVFVHWKLKSLNVLVDSVLSSVRGTKKRRRYFTAVNLEELIDRRQSLVAGYCQRAVMILTYNEFRVLLIHCMWESQQLPDSNQLLNIVLYMYLIHLQQNLCLGQLAQPFQMDLEIRQQIISHFTSVFLVHNLCCAMNCLIRDNELDQMLFVLL